MASQAQTQQRREEIAAEALGYFDEPVRSQFRKRYRSASRDSRYREDAMFYMGAAWAVFRPLALELGRRLVKVGSLSTDDDIFYLTNDELFARGRTVVGGCATRSDCTVEHADNGKSTIGC